MCNYRNALAEEFNFLKSFIFKHGPNPWNSLPADGINKTFSLLIDNHGEALVACEGETIIGLAIFFYPSALPEKFQQYAQSKPAIYVAEVVVHNDYSGRGIGSQLLNTIIAKAPDLGARKVLLDRHEENAPSAGMMRRAGFVEICTFSDLDRRHSGSRKTTVLSFELNGFELDSFDL
jgi:GNAT superfamily N-acetyltransferase